MKFSCEKTLLQATISTTSRAISPKSLILALEGILLEAGSDLRPTGYNLETGIRTIVPAGIREEDTLALSARLFGEIVCEPLDDIVTFQSGNYMVNIKCGVSGFNILGTDPKEPPELPTVEYQNSLILPQSRLKAMINQTPFAVGDNEGHPAHTDSLFEVDSEELTTVSVDGYRLTLRHEPIDKKEGAKTFSFVMPGAALSEVGRVCNDVDKLVSVTQDTCHMIFRVEGTMLVSCRPEGEFLACRRAILHNNTIHVEDDTRVLLSSIDRVPLIISGKLKSPLRCVFDSNLLKTSTKTAIGDAYDRYPLSGDGGGLEIGFNNKYLMDALKAIPTDKVRLKLTTGVSPCVVPPAEGEENFLYMVLPTWLKAGK